ncbi:MAG: hypothetical protein IKK36_10580 [Bacteroidales bacterium]|nr:hypothetical protein [Bacteroidales bacterium]
MKKFKNFFEKVLPLWIPRAFPMLILIFLLVLIIIGVVGLNKNSLGEDAEKSVYMRNKDEGFFRHSKALFSELLLFEKADVQVKSIDDLNKKYPAFKFSLPYLEDSLTFTHVVDIRCVGINENYLDSLTNNDLKVFYYNSRLPQLFKLQEKEMGNVLLKIDYDKNKLKIRHIRLIPSMFKVPLDKIRWKSTIYGQESPLFPNDSTIFFSWGRTVAPIRIGAEGNNLSIINDTSVSSEKYMLIVNGNNDVKLPHNGYYEYCEYYKNNCPRLILYLDYLDGCRNIGGNRKIALRICIKSVNDKLKVFLRYEKLDNNDVSAFVYTEDGSYELKDWQKHGDETDVVDFVDGMKIVICDNKEKYAEFILSKQNPMCILSSEIKTNKGYERYIINECYTDIFTQQLLRGLNSALPYCDYNEDITLSLDPILAHEMENEMRLYLEKLKGEFSGKDKKCGGALWDMSLTIMDLESGNVLAAPCISDRVDMLSGSLKYAQRNTALQRRHIGSTFKPLLALAAVLTNKSLLNLDTRDNKYSYGNPCDFLGTKVGQWARPNSKTDHWKGCNFKEFISRSDDVYPAALVALCMNGFGLENLCNKRTLKRYPSNSIFKDNYSGYLAIKSYEDKELGDYSLFKILDILYDVYAYGEGDRSGDTSRMPETYVWRKLKRYDYDSLAMDIITPDYTNMNYNKTLQVRNASFKGQWVPWILGQGGNDWSCIKLAEAYSRMVSKKKVRASFVSGASQNESLDSILCSHPDVGKTHERDLAYIKNAWNGFLHIFAEAQKEGTLLKPMYEAMKIVDGNLVLFSKTGTPDQYERLEDAVIDGEKQNLDVAYYCFGLMTKDSYNKVKAGKQPKGIVCVIRITRKLVKKESGDGLWSFHARNFFSNDYNRLKKFYEMTKIYY